MINIFGQCVFNETDSDVARTLQLIHGCMGKILNKMDKQAMAELVRYFTKLKLIVQSPRFSLHLLYYLGSHRMGLGCFLVSGFINILKLLNT